MTGRIELIELRNFGPFSNRNIEFPRKKECDLNIIIGDNSFGKSSLLKSFKWTLYGDVEEGELKAVKHESAIHDETRVKFHIEKAKRHITFTRSDRTGTSCNALDEDNKSLPSDFDQETNALLPRVVKDFFLFRGEFLSNLFEKYNTEELKRAILKLSKIDRFSIIKEAIEKNEELYREEMIKIERSNDQLKKFDEKIRSYSDAIKSTEEQITELTNRIREYTTQKNSATDQLMDLTRNLGELNAKIQEKNRLENDKESIVNLRRSKEPELKSLFTSALADGFVARQIVAYSHKIKELEEEGRYPPQINPPLLQDSLHAHKCVICQHPLTTENEQKLQVLLNEVLKAKKNMPLYNLAERSSTRIDTLKGDIERFEYRLKEYYDLSEKKDTLSEDIRKLQDEIGVDAEGQLEIQRLTALIGVLEKNISRDAAEIEQLRSKTEDLQLGLADSISKFNRAKNKSSTDSEIEFKARLATELKNDLDHIYEQLRKELARQLQEETKKFYDQIFSRIYKENRYDIVVDENFRIKVFSHERFDRLAEGKLSTGEYKVLSLSFLLALSHFYGFEFPIVIDAPFSDLGTNVRKELVQALINLSKEKQVILFTLPNLEQEIMSELKSNSNVIYEFVSPGELRVIR